MRSSTSSSTRHVVCRLEELPPGERREIGVGGEYGIVVFNIGGRLYALRNKCPHKGGPLGLGPLRPHVVGEGVGQWVYEREGEIIQCPYHHWEFDVRTGRALCDPGLRAKTYRVEVEDCEVVLYRS